jgi:peptidoglycan/LPS O-acetylase OafA/YrhL
VFDLVRGLAALAVCAMHLRGALLPDAGAVALSGLERIAYFASGLGHEAVMVFFVLSGFFVGGQVLRSRADFSPARYAQARLVRLWVVLVPALGLTFGVDHALARLDPGVLAGGYFNAWCSGPEPGHYAADLRTLLANLTFNQTILAPVFGTNGPLWSLANEFWYYVMFPAALLAAGFFPARRSAAFRLGAAAVLVFALAWVPGEFFRGFVIWILGAGLAALAHQRRLPDWTQSTAARFASSALAATALLAARLHLLDQSWLHPEHAGGGAFVLWAATWVHGDLRAPSLRRLAQGLSEISYSLYLCHLPVVLLISIAVYGGRELTLSPGTWMAYVGWFAASVGFAIVFWAAFERHTPRVRRWLDDRS